MTLFQRMTLLLAGLLLATLPALAEAVPGGQLLLIGGGKRPAAVMQHFFRLSGGYDALILIVPTASELADTGEFYERQFTEMGCRNVRALPLATRAEAATGPWQALLPQAGGIFFTGGDQRRIINICRDTPFETELKKAFDRGLVVCGTSAGLACMSELMITGDGAPEVIRVANMELWPGLGLFPHAILDQHFIKRQRANRLIAVVLEHPGYLGIGVDEATAVWLKPDRTLEVMGEGSVMVVDPAEAEIHRNEQGSLGVRSLKIHLLLPGDTFPLAPVARRSE
ncbi:MAG: cyanophycinase [Acidobacteria bacterium]|nr:cyanophycinase [Acidobacteriota bacterium]